MNCQHHIPATIRARKGFQCSFHTIMMLCDLTHKLSVHHQQFLSMTDNFAEYSGLEKKNISLCQCNKLIIPSNIQKTAMWTVMNTNTCIKILRYKGSTGCNLLQHYVYIYIFFLYICYSIAKSSLTNTLNFTNIEKVFTKTILKIVHPAYFFHTHIFQRVHDEP